MKKLFFFVFLILVFGLLFLIGFSTSRPRKKSSILREKTQVEKKADNKFVIHMPMASLPKGRETPPKNLVSLLGKIVQVPSNEKDLKSKEIIMLESSGKEHIVLTNIPYVHTIELVYLNKNVMLSGIWLKNAIIFGKEYKSFWVEDVELVREK
jgi:hypothetical protein